MIEINSDNVRLLKDNGRTCTVPNGRLCPADESYVDSIREQVELVKLKGEDHWLSVADTRMQTLREMDRFISEHLPLE